MTEFATEKATQEEDLPHEYEDGEDGHCTKCGGAEKAPLHHVKDPEKAAEIVTTEKGS